MRKFLMLAAVGLLAACGGDSSTGVNANPEGTYTLRTVNGAPLPYVLSQNAASKLEITDDVFTLNSGGTWTESGHSRTTQNGQVTTASGVDAGTYTLTGTAISLRSNSDGSVTSGTLSGSTLTIVDQGLSAVFTK